MLANQIYERHGRLEPHPPIDYRSTEFLTSAFDSRGRRKLEISRFSPGFPLDVAARAWLLRLQRIRAHQFGFQDIAVREANFDCISAIDYVIVGNDVTFAVNEKTGTLRFHALRFFRKRAVAKSFVWFAKAEPEKLLQTHA